MPQQSSLPDSCLLACLVLTAGSLGDSLCTAAPLHKSTNHQMPRGDCSASLSAVLTGPSRISISHRDVLRLVAPPAPVSPTPQAACTSSVPLELQPPANPQRLVSTLPLYSSSSWLRVPSSLVHLDDRSCMGSSKTSCQVNHHIRLVPPSQRNSPLPPDPSERRFASHVALSSALQRGSSLIVLCASRRGGMPTFVQLRDI
jgi:hypothetical protein